MTNMKRNAWIDAAKTVAIIGVVFQHLWGWAYDNEILYNSIFYAVGLFVMIGGYNAYGSFLRRGSCAVGKRIAGILIPYVIATIVYVAVSGKGTDPAEYIQRLIHFDACAPMYYVAVYIWLVIATPVLARLLKWSLGTDGRLMKILRLGLSIAAVVLVSDLCTRYTDIFGIILGGGKVLAGPWLMFHYAGMCIRGLEAELVPKPVGGEAETDIADMKTEGNVSRADSKKSIILFAFLTIALLAWEHLFVIRGFNKGFAAIFGYGDILLTWFGGLEILLMFLWFVTAERVIGCPKVLGLLGRHSLYIFLYHILFLRLYVDHLLTRMLNISHLLNRICLILAVFAGPVFISVIVKRLKTLIFSK